MKLWNFSLSDFSQQAYQVWKWKFWALVNFLSLSQVWSMLIISILILTTTLWVLTSISSSMNTSVYEIKFYSTEEAEEKFQSTNTEDNFKTIKKLISFWSTFTYSFLKKSWFTLNEWDWLYELIKSNINNYNKNNLNFDESTNTKMMNNIKKIQTKYWLFWSHFDKFLFHDQMSQINMWWSFSNKYVLKDYFINKWWLLKVSCLLPQLWWKRTISKTWECSNIWYYVALKEFLLENSDIDIAFPISTEDWNEIYLKKFTENWWLTWWFQKFKDFLESKNISNLFYVWEYWKKNSLIDWIKKTYFYQLVFDWIFSDSIWIEFINWNTMWLIDRRMTWQSDQKNEKKEEEIENKKDKKKWKDKIEIYEENWSFYVDWLNELEIAQLNYNITRRITDNLFTSFDSVLEWMLEIDNTISNDSNWCLMKLTKWWYIIKYDTDYLCDLIKEMKWSTEIKSFFDKIQERTENFWADEISTVNFQIKAFWMWFTDWLTWFWTLWVQKINWKDFLALKKFYFQHDDLWDDSVWRLWTIIWISIWFVFIVFYFSFYITIFFIISLILWMLYINLSEQFSKKEKEAQDLETLAEKNKQFDSLSQISAENAIEN